MGIGYTDCCTAATLYKYQLHWPKRDTWVNATHLSTNKCWNCSGLNSVSLKCFFFSLVVVVVVRLFQSFISFNRFHIEHTLSKINAINIQNRIYDFSNVFCTHLIGNGIAMFAFFYDYDCAIGAVPFHFSIFLYKIGSCHFHSPVSWKAIYVDKLKQL